MNTGPDIYVIGAGGHAKVVIATLRESGYTIKAVLDDDPKKVGKDLLGVQVVGPPSQLENLPESRAVVAIGVNSTRKAIAERFPRTEWVSAVHPTACVHPSVRLGPGTVVFAGAVIQPDTHIGAHCIVNTSASIDHDCLLEDYVHVAPGVNLAGGVRLEQGVFVGIGSAIIPSVTVGCWTVVGAGGVVVRDLAGQSLAIGVPARPTKKRE
jgi:sugar O-acyltransferase (sialic acid O-acetyltransferase NeuD family)